MVADPQPDRSDLAALQSGNDQGLNRLMARWQQPLFHFAFRYLQNAADAKDVVTEVFVVLYRQCGRLKADTTVSAWLFTVTANRCLNQLRWRQRHPSENWDGLEDHPATAAAEATPDHALVRQETQEQLAAAIEALPHDLKVVLLLHHYEALSYREIAAIVNCGERGVETRLYRARQQLRKLLAQG